MTDIDEAIIDLAVKDPDFHGYLLVCAFPEIHLRSEIKAFLVDHIETLPPEQYEQVLRLHLYDALGRAFPTHKDKLRLYEDCVAPQYEEADHDDQ